MSVTFGARVFTPSKFASDFHVGATKNESRPLVATVELTPDLVTVMPVPASTCVWPLVATAPDMPDNFKFEFLYIPVCFYHQQNYDSTPFAYVLLVLPLVSSTAIAVTWMLSVTLTVSDASVCFIRRRILAMRAVPSPTTPKCDSWKS